MFINSVNFSRNLNPCVSKNTLSASLMNFSPFLRIFRQFTRRKYLIENKKLQHDLCQEECFVANHRQLSQLWLCLQPKTFPPTIKLFEPKLLGILHFTYILYYPNTHRIAVSFRWQFIDAFFCPILRAHTPF